MGELDRQRLREGILGAVEAQVRDGEPPETKQTLDRLVGAGFSRDEALVLIARVLTAEIFTIVRRGGDFDAARYVAALGALPNEIPGEDDDEPGRGA
jgi:hypothetical protein